MFHIFRYTDTSTIVYNDSYAQDAPSYFSSGSESDSSFNRCRSGDELDNSDSSTGCSKIVSEDDDEGSASGNDIDDDLKGPSSHVVQCDHKVYEQQYFPNGNPSILFNDYEIGHVRSTDVDCTGESQSARAVNIDKNSDEKKVKKKMTYKEMKHEEDHAKKLTAEKDRKEQYQKEVENHAVNRKYRELKNQLSKTENKASMKSARDLWFEEVS
jgi:hypothetical protein